ncbi:nitrate reductase molybdenum cofactor assembly chaperone [Rouxiella badensis]|uniref:nitrate reductase molybdenum cofactor assembly chaperone n=1 Tax=Rouxiella badensis TaxID=1646377 RepID=UPI001B46E0BE|nr:nitrate reductase molybdenum cofactor assembly chaperone [Rouxiella badensis]MCC3747270.1 nitrate reductase molybdenum cofactor assembly chaperone [Rouxiella badensis]
MIALRIISRLLDYPDDALWAHKQDLLLALTESPLLSLEETQQLADFIRQFCAADLLDRQAEYCSLFDRGRATSLLLFEHVHGESRDRGQAMVDLLDQYRAANLEIDSKELPDYLPLYLEYLAMLAAEEAQAGLLNIAPILALLSARLTQRENHYALLFNLLLSLSGATLTADSVAEKLQHESRDDTPQALDAVWEDEQIKFLGEQGCLSEEEKARGQRFAGAVAAQYIQLDAGHPGVSREEKRP